MNLKEIQNLFKDNKKRGRPYVEVEGVYEGVNFSGFLLKNPEDGPRTKNLLLLMDKRLGWRLEYPEESVAKALLGLPRTMLSGWNLSDDYDAGYLHALYPVNWNFFSKPMNE